MAHLNFDIFTVAICFICFIFNFFPARFLNMCKPRKTFYLLWWAGPPELVFYGSGLACLRSWLGIVNVGCLDRMQSYLLKKSLMENLLFCAVMRSEIFLQMKFIIFQDCRSMSSAPNSATFACSRMLFCITCWN